MKYLSFLAVLLTVTSCSPRFEAQEYDKRWETCEVDEDCKILDPGQCGYTVNKNYISPAMRYYYPNGYDKPMCLQKSNSAEVECVKNKCEKIDENFSY